MAETHPARWRTIAIYVHATHVLLATCSFMFPTGRVIFQPGGPGWDGALTIMLAGAVTVGGSLVLGVEYAPSHPLVSWLRRGRGRRVLLVIVVLAAAFGLLLVLSRDERSTIAVAGAPLAWAFLAAARGPFWTAYGRLLTATVVCTGISATYTALTSPPWNPLPIFVAALIAFGVLGQDSIYSLAIELDDLRTRDTERAVIRERKRFAGDLHDIQGQHLSLIAVEAQLIHRLIERGDHTAAAVHADRVRTITLEALDEMHRVVHANRDVTLSDEVANAARVLEAAGITAHSETLDTSGLDAETDRLLGLTVREAITNVLKHTRAASCRIEIHPETREGIAGITVRVIDSGPNTPTADAGRTGTGVSALRDRYLALDGRLDLTIGTGGTLVGWLPTQDGGKR